MSRVIGAAECKGIGVNYTIDPFPIQEQSSSIKVNFSNIKDSQYRLRFALIIPGHHVYSSEESASDGKLTITVDSQDRKLENGDHDSTLEIFDPSSNSWQDYCQNVKYTVGYSLFTCKLTITPFNPTDAEQIRVNITNSSAGEYVLLLNQKEISTMTVGNDGSGTTVIGPISTPMSNARLQALPKDKVSSHNYSPVCAITNFTITASGGASPRPISTPPTAPAPHKPGLIVTSATTPCDGDGIKTAIGCIHTSPVGFVQDGLKFVLGISGGLAFLMMILGAFQMMTSAGNPDTLKAGQDRLTSAVIGLLFVIFATLLLQIIGIDILKLPGFGR